MGYSHQKDWGRWEKWQVHGGAVLTAKSGVVLDMALVAFFGGGSRLKSLLLGGLLSRGC